MKLRTRILIDAQELIADKRRWGQGSMESAPPREAEQKQKRRDRDREERRLPCRATQLCKSYISAYDSLKRRLYTFERRLNE